MNHWYLKVDGDQDAATNMALDHHLLELVEQGGIDRPVLRLYGWSKPTLSLGFHQRIARAVRPPVAHRLGVELVRRWTGGRAVLHDRELTYALVAPTRAPFSTRIADNYARIGRALAHFTDGLGRAAPEDRVGNPTPPSAGAGMTAPCFASIATSEIENKRRKLIGSSQKIGRGAFLQHGSIALVEQGEMLRALTGSDMDVSSYMVTLEELFAETGREVPPRDQLVGKLVQAFEVEFGVRFEPLDDVIDPERVQAVRADVYANRDWTYRR